MRCYRVSCLLIVACCAALAGGGCTALIADSVPVAVITAAPLHGTAPLVVHLSAAASRDDAAIADYTWTFPDEDAPPCSGREIERDYDRSGTYIVRLTVTDSGGQSATTETVITVDNTAPIASCRFSNDAPIPEESVLFDASASYDPDGELVDFIWDFGDETVQRGTRVSHTYDAIGVYTVQLTIVDNGGAAATVSHTMTVHEASSGGGCSGGSCGG
jgi:PKD repeat protein